MRRVTELLQQAGLRGDMPWFTPEQRQYYLDRGTWVHKATILVDQRKFDWEAPENAAFLGYALAYSAFLKAFCPVVLEYEQEVESSQYDYVGHLDRVYRIVGKKVVLCDIKTTEVDLATRLQTCAYQLARTGKFISRIGLALHGDGTFKTTWWDRVADWDVDREGWLTGVLPNNQEAVGKWKQRVGWTETR